MLQRFQYHFFNKTFCSTWTHVAVIYYQGEAGMMASAVQNPSGMVWSVLLQRGLRSFTPYIGCVVWVFSWEVVTFCCCILCNILMSSSCKFMQEKWPLFWCVYAALLALWGTATGNATPVMKAEFGPAVALCLVWCDVLRNSGMPFNLSFLSCEIDKYWTIGMGWSGGKLGKLLPRLGSSITIISK